MEIEIEQVYENIKKKYGYDRVMCSAYLVGWMWTDLTEEQKLILLNATAKPLLPKQVINED